MKPINEEILCAGHGGQGIMLMGRLLAYAGMHSGYNVTWIPSYGAEVRGGTAHSMIRIQTGKEISNPIITNPTTCIVMNKPSLLKFSKRVQKKGLLLIDNSQVDSIPSVKNIVIKKAPFTKIALQLGNKKVANMIAVGALNKIKEFFPIEELIRHLSFMFQKRPDLIPINEKALCEGYHLSVE